MAAHALGSRPRTGDVLQGPGEASDFSSLLLSRPVLEGLEAAGFTKPSPIQSKAIPLGRCGLDLIVQAKSGTGKTCVFSTVALDSLILENTTTQILVLAPTREIAVQIHSVIISIGSRLEGLECHVFIGGTPLPQDKVRLKKCHIAVGSPGRIKQLIEMGYLNTSSIRLFILDEADKLLEVGSFQEQINWIYSSLPTNKQMLAVSATYPESLAKALTKYMREPTFVRLNVTDPSLIGLKQYYKVVNSHPLPHKTFEEKVQHLLELFSRVPFNQALVFSNLHSRAQHLSDVLTAKGFPAVCISGSMNQNQRLDAMAKLKHFHCRVLISTDLLPFHCWSLAEHTGNIWKCPLNQSLLQPLIDGAGIFGLFLCFELGPEKRQGIGETSRGIDAEKVNLVINLDVPYDWETYMHRIGRAGRFGTYGLSVSYCCRGEEENLMMSIAQKCNLQLLPLPEPIPDGLMEEACDWNVEIMSMKNTSQTVMSEVKMDESPKMQNPGINTLPELGTSSRHTKTTQPKQKKLAKKKTTEKANPQEWLHKETSSLPKKPADNSKPKKTEGLGNDGKIHQGMDNSLPKIPSLSSFKRPVVCTSSFAELVEDYEQFIKEGLEKHVEVIRVYSDTGGHAERLSSENLDIENSSIDMSSEDVNPPEQCDLSADSSDESYSSSSSLSECEDSSEESTHSQEELKTEERSSSCPDLPSGRTEGAAVCQVNVDDFPVPPEDVQQASLVKENSYVGKGVIISNSKKLRKRGKKVTQLSRRELCTEAQDDMYQLDYMNASAYPYGTTSYADYWRSYYQAWQHYHSAASSSYYRNVYKCSNWMSAYQMHSVYLHEMLKP